ncbi:6,7-dimethyl-8-ribityllumazine synthase [Brevibacterium otitidis]|uniref:6,7-dimethyl-8-ribityllumazine synthase n=1 Tax=Brevibacterium otitidis TaxID=53364 RepID=A0ABV5WZY1_9MICO|nr:6,7-dimethyl-8-ribityllumazine synthase [Brevibacterium otitidis]
MASSGAPTMRPQAAPGTRVAIVASSWHTEVMDGLLAGAQRALDEAAAETTGLEVSVFRAPGSFELPLLARAAAERFDAVVALGVVIRGGTPHFDYVCRAATDGLAQVAAETGTPVGFGLLTCDDDEQARNRAGLPGSREDKGHEAASAALAALAALGEIAAA